MPYFDLPVHHSHPDVIKSINGAWQASLSELILSKIREEIPSAVLRTIHIVGFPGEKKNILNIFLNFWIDTNLIMYEYLFFLLRKELQLLYFKIEDSEIAEASKDKVI